MSGAPDSLVVHRLTTRCRLPHAHPAPETIRRRLDALGHDALPDLLRRAVVTRTEGVWLIRRLELDVAIHLGWDIACIARRWSARILDVLHTALEERGGDNVQWFPDRAHFIAQFLADCLNGCAWERWYYREFEGLKSLPGSAAIRTVLCEYDVAAADVLKALPRNAIPCLAQAVTPADAEQILHRLAAGPAARGEIDEAMILLLAHWDEVFAKNAPSADRLKMLVASIRLIRIGPRLPSAVLYRALVAATRLVAALHEGREVAEGLERALERVSPSALYQAVPSHAEDLAPLLELPIETRRAVLERVRQDVDPRWGVAPADRAIGRYTRFGAAFLLAPLIDSLPLPDPKRWPQAEGVAAHVPLRFWLLLKCLGAQYAERAFFDPPLRELLSVPPSLDIPAFRRWQSWIPDGDLLGWLDAVVQWQRSRRSIGAEAGVLWRRSVGGRDIAVLEDAAGGWLASCPWSEPLPPSFRHGARDYGHNLFVESESVEEWRNRLPELAAADLSSAPAALAQAVARADRIGEDIQWLLLPEGLRARPAPDCRLNMAAHAVLRSLARRLPGFSHSSLPYLHRNFLDVDGRWRSLGRVESVELGQPPLHIVLSMTGAGRDSYCLSWRPERPFRVEVG